MVVSKRVKKAFLYGCAIEAPLAIWFLNTSPSYGIPWSVIVHFPGLVLGISIDIILKALNLTSFERQFNDFLSHHSIINALAALLGYMVFFGPNVILFSLLALRNIPKDQN